MLNTITDIIEHELQKLGWNLFNNIESPRRRITAHYVNSQNRQRVLIRWSRTDDCLHIEYSYVIHHGDTGHRHTELQFREKNTHRHDIKDPNFNLPAIIQEIHQWLLKPSSTS